MFFWSLRLSKKSQRYCGIISYSGGPHYKAKKFVMGLNLSPAVWTDKINSILSLIPGSKRFCVVKMDDLCIFSPDKKSHFKHIEAILKVLKKHGLKISPKKLKLFKTSLIYLGYEILIKNGCPCIKAMAKKTCNTKSSYSH